MVTRIVRCERCGRKNRVPAAASGSPRCGNCHAPLPWIADADNESFAEIAEQSAVPVVVDLWASWCMPCKMVSPALEQVARELAGQGEAGQGRHRCLAQAGAALFRRRRADPHGDAARRGDRSSGGGSASPGTALLGGGSDRRHKVTLRRAEHDTARRVRTERPSDSAEEAAHADNGGQ